MPAANCVVSLKVALPPTRFAVPTTVVPSRNVTTPAGVPLAGGLADTLVLTAVTYARPFEGKRFVDIAENCGYWYFVVLTWLPIYAVVYFGARF